MLKAWLSTLALLLLAAPAFAADAWVTEPGGTLPCNFVDHRACWWEVAQSGSVFVTTVIDTQWCENWTASWFNNIAAATHNNIASVYENGNGFTISATDLTAEKVANADLTGDPADPDLFQLRGFDGVYVYARFTMNDAGSTGRLVIHCHPRAN